MTYRNRKLLDIAHDAPCFLELAPTCSNHASVPCHSDQLQDGRGVGHKSHDCLAIPGCPDCHAIFDRRHLGVDYFVKHAMAFKRYMVWLWENGRIGVI